MISILDRYIALTFIKKFSVIFLAFFILIFSIDIIENIRHISARLTFLNIIENASLNSLIIISKILFFITFLAILFSFIKLQKSSELHIIFNSGISIWRLSFPILLLVILISLTPAIIFSNIHQDFNKIQHQSIYKFGNNGIWLKEKNSKEYFLFNFKQYNNQNSNLENIKIICFKCSLTANKSIIFAKKAKFIDNKLHLFDNKIFQNTIIPHKSSQIIFDVNFEEDFVISLIKNHNKNKYSFFQLPTHIQKLEANGINAIYYKIILHEYLSTPLFFICIFLLAILISNYQPRQHNYANIILKGILFNFLIYFILVIFNNLILLKIGNILTFVYLPKILLILTIFYAFTKKHI